jgi:hypothetical protein
VTDVRRRRINEQHDRRGTKIEPGWRARHDLMRAHHRLTERGWARVLAAFRADTTTTMIDGDLSHAWAAKEDLAELLQECRTRHHARQRLLWWYWWVSEHPVPQLVKLATTISEWERVPRLLRHPCNERADRRGEPSRQARQTPRPR